MLLSQKRIDFPVVRRTFITRARQGWLSQIVKVLVDSATTGRLCSNIIHYCIKRLCVST